MVAPDLHILSLSWLASLPSALLGSFGLFGEGFWWSVSLSRCIGAVNGAGLLFFTSAFSDHPGASLKRE